MGTRPIKLAQALISTFSAIAPHRCPPMPKASQLTRRRRNLPRHERSKEILEAALGLFAENGFNATLQELADRVGVTQPLLHRYFPTKANLIAACRQELMRGHWKPEWRAVIADRDLPLVTRMERFYLDYLPRIYRRYWYRTFMFIALSDAAFAQAYLQQCSREVLDIIVAEARHDFGFPGTAKVPIHEREYELVWGMHSTFVFLGVRQFIYNMAMPSDLPALIRDQMMNYLFSSSRLMDELMPRAPRNGRAKKSRRVRRRSRKKAKSS
jgi:AcrR family transcriptional regulator